MGALPRPSSGQKQLSRNQAPVSILLNAESKNLWIILMGNPVSEGLFGSRVSGETPSDGGRPAAVPEHADLLAKLAMLHSDTLNIS